MKEITPEGLLQEAERNWFEVGVRDESLYLLGGHPNNGWVQKLMIRRGQKLLKRISLMPAQIVLNPKAGTLIVYVDGVEEEFLRATREMTELKKRRTEHNLAFDSKVEEEVRQDPEVIRLGREVVRAAPQRTAAAVAALGAREVALREEKEGLRDAFLYVAEEREL